MSSADCMIMGLSGTQIEMGGQQWGFILKGYLPSNICYLVYQSPDSETETETERGEFNRRLTRRSQDIKNVPRPHPRASRDCRLNPSAEQIPTELAIRTMPSPARQFLSGLLALLCLLLPSSLASSAQTDPLSKLRVK